MRKKAKPGDEARHSGHRLTCSPEVLGIGCVCVCVCAWGTGGYSYHYRWPSSWFEDWWVQGLRSLDYPSCLRGVGLDGVHTGGCCMHSVSHPRGVGLVTWPCLQATYTTYQYVTVWVGFVLVSQWQADNTAHLLLYLSQAILEMAKANRKEGALWWLDTHTFTPETLMFACLYWKIDLCNVHWQ